jgi:hypothetical protein
MTTLSFILEVTIRRFNLSNNQEVRDALESRIYDLHAQAYAKNNNLVLKLTHEDGKLHIEVISQASK